MKPALWSALLLLAVAAPAFAAEGATTATVHTPQFQADISKAPDLQPWAHAAEALCEVWYPRIVAYLKSDDNVRPLPPVVKLVFDPSMTIPAYVSGPEMHIWTDWVHRHPDDLGMVIHELTHLVQRYQNAGSGWLVEGIADYVRLNFFEPSVRTPHINFEKAKYTDSYKTTAAFLIWMDGKYGPDLVPKLHALLRNRKFTDASFKDLTGKEVNELWTEFAAARPAIEAQMGK